MKTQKRCADLPREAGEIGCQRHMHVSSRPTPYTVEEVAARANAEFIGWARSAAEELIKTLGAAPTTNLSGKSLPDAGHLEETPTTPLHIRT